MEKRVLQERSASSLNIRKKSSLKQRNTKQLMEKRRRARINNCLETLKTIVLKNTNQDVSQFSKLEKADILEMAVQYMEGIQKTKQSGSKSHTNENNPCSNFQTGYQESTDEVMRLIDSSQAAERGQERLCMKQRRKDMSSISAQDENLPPNMPSEIVPGVPKSSLSSEDNSVVQRNILPRVNNFYLPELNHDVLADVDYNMARTSNNLWRPW
ncbi:protein hairy-like [Liolophura sinensis]|uniref:protein hairy-like n=1 Tax=Liolophura sinensis TaxID=3198878 RepID=UPI0031594D49